MELQRPFIIFEDMVELPDGSLPWQAYICCDSLARVGDKQDATCCCNPTSRLGNVFVSTGSLYITHLFVWATACSMQHRCVPAVISVNRDTYWST